MTETKLLAFARTKRISFTFPDQSRRRKGKLLYMKKPDTCPFLTSNQVGDWLGYSPRTITDWAQQYIDSGGKEGIPGFKLRRAWKFERQTIQQWLEEKQNNRSAA